MAASEIIKGMNAKGINSGVGFSPFLCRSFPCQISNRRIAGRESTRGSGPEMFDDGRRGNGDGISILSVLLVKPKYPVS
jgi:hypothetical protein